jgi:DNA-binding CsgD family transcriptional regulator
VDRLLERDTVLAELHRCGRAALRGGGRVVLLRGEAGVGKTAVIARFIAGLDPRARVVRGWCDALATPRPLGPLIDMLGQLSGEQAAGVRAAIAVGDPEAIYAGLVAMFGDGNAWVCVIEDAHWADGATLDLLRFLARRIDALPVLLVVSHRDDEIGDQHPLAVLLGDVATTAAVTRIALDRLSGDAVAVLAADSGVNAAALYRLTAGNPFFVTEILTAGSDALGDGALPRSVSEAVAGRLARLSAAARDTVQAAAVCGPRAHPTLLAAVCPDATGALAECLDAGVLVADADTVGFRHELARRATAEQIPAYQRRLLHKRALTVLAEPPIDPDTLGMLAFHADQADDTDAVIRYGPAAAERAARLGAHREAADLHALVLRHADTTAATQKVVWLEAHAFESYLSGQPQTAVASWREAIGLRQELGDRLEEGEDLRWLSRILSLNRVTQATEAGQRSLRLLEGLGPSTQLAWSLVNMAHLAAVGYDPACAEYAARAITLGTQLGDRAVVLRARGYAAMTTVFRSSAGWNEFEAVWREAVRTEGLAEHAADLGVLICWTAVLSRDLDRAEGYLAETAAFCDDHDLGVFRALVAGAGALVGLYRGDWDRAALAADQVLTRPELSPQHRILPLVALALIRARRGEQPVAPLLDEAADCAISDDQSRQWLARAARAETAWLAGDDDTARTEAQAGLAAAAQHAEPWLVGQLRRWVYLAGGPTETASGDPLTPYELEISGDWQAAAQAWTRRGCPYDAAIAQLGGDIDAVGSALATFRRLGARAAARRAQQRLAHLRGRNPDLRRNDTSADPHGLTKRQREILELLAAGNSDTEIATALHISPKTANTHVCAIMAKLGVHNRTQAAAHARQPAPSPQ